MNDTTAGELEGPIPLFPLHTVLFPDGLLPLRIFEPRYLDMVGESMREDRPFGIVPIEQGPDTGSAAHFFDVGTTARIVSFDQGDDGLLQIVVRGERAFRVTSHDRRANDLLVGEVEYLEPTPEEPLPEEYEHFRVLLQEIYDNKLEDVDYEERHMDRALWVAHRLGEVVPLHVLDKVAILTAGSAGDKLSRLDAALSELRKHLQEGSRD